MADGGVGVTTAAPPRLTHISLEGVRTPKQPKLNWVYRTTSYNSSSSIIYSVYQKYDSNCFLRAFERQNMGLRKINMTTSTAYISYHTTCHAKCPAVEIGTERREEERKRGRETHKKRESHVRVYIICILLYNRCYCCCCCIDWRPRPYIYDRIPKTHGNLNTNLRLYQVSHVPVWYTRRSLSRLLCMVRLLLYSLLAVLL